MKLREATRPLASALQSGHGTLGLYLAITLLMTFPLVLSWRSALPAGAGDVWQNYWNFWWWKHCLLNGLNPLQSSMLFHPFGTDLFFHTHSPFNQVIAMPVNLLFGEAAAYNFCVVLSLTLCGFGTFLFVRDLTKSPEAGFIAGVIFAYFPQTLEQTLEHLNLFSAQFIPLTLFYLLRWSRTQRAADALAFGACFALNALCSWHLGLKLTFLVGPWMAWLAWQNRGRWKRFLGSTAIAAGLATLMVLPLLSPMISLIADGSEYFLKGPVPRGIDPSYLLTPAYANPLFGGLVESRYLERAYQSSGFVCYLGFVPLALAALGLRRSVRHAWPWGVVLVVGVVLAMGADLLWNGTRYESVRLPFASLRGVPFVENLRVANRFMLLAGLALSVLAGYGWKTLRGRLGWGLALVTTLILAEYSWHPFPVRQVDHSPLLEQVASQHGAVLNIPFHQRSRTVHNMVDQTVHGRPISGGYLSSYPPEVEARLRNEPALASLAGLPEPDAVVDVKRLRELGFGTIVIHKYRLQSHRNRLLDALRPDDLLERKRILRLGGIPDETMAAIRAQIDAMVGPATMEDDILAIYFL